MRYHALGEVIFLELYKEMLCKELGKLFLETVTNMEIGFEEIANAKANQTLQKIKAVLEDDSLDDFMCVEAIVLVFESAGISVGYRHDFG